VEENLDDARLLDMSSLGCPRSSCLVPPTQNSWKKEHEN
jgi:hypothetical protein